MGRPVKTSTCLYINLYCKQVFNIKRAVCQYQHTVDSSNTYGHIYTYLILYDIRNDIRNDIPYDYA